jgi:hypothetical protein
MAIKNYTSDKPIADIFAELQHTLATHGAKHISFEYGDDGKVHGVAFTIKVHDRFVPIQLPARVEQAQAVLERQYKSGVIKSHIGTKVYSSEQAYRVAMLKLSYRPKLLHYYRMVSYQWAEAMQADADMLVERQPGSRHRHALVA